MENVKAVIADIIGHGNDKCLLPGQPEARAGELSKVETEAIGAYLRSREREVARRRRGLGPIWRAVNGAPFRRALGRATAAL